MANPNAGTEAIAQTAALLSKFPDAELTVERREAAMHITPALDGTFAISIYDQGDNAMISAERWHTHYEDPFDVAFCALWLLTPFYRIVQEFKANLFVCVWIERYEPSGWVGFEPVYYLNPEHRQDWEAKPGETFVRKYFQQGVIHSPETYERLCPGILLDENGLPACQHLGPHEEESNKSVGITLFGA